MYEDDDAEEQPTERAPNDPAVRAKEKSDEFRMHAELAAVFEGNRKFEAQIRPDLDPALARDVQRAMGKLANEKEPDSPVLPESVAPDAIVVLHYPKMRGLSTNDYHVSRRPGETMIARWLAGEEVESFYARIQAHFDAALNGFRTEERSSKEWRGDETTLKYLDALDAIDVKMADRYLREPIQKLGIFVLSTQAADEVNIAYLCDYIMGIPAAEIVGEASAPPDGASDAQLAWYFKLFSLRGVIDGVERMCFFTYLQKSDEDFDF
jgi:hypothetical protein